MKKLIVFFIVCLTIQLLLIGKVSADGGEILILDQKVNTFKEENRRLEAQIAKNISCHSVAEKAAQAGFVSVAALRKDTSMALKR
jgi:cell division protein FtsL